MRVDENALRDFVAENAARRYLEKRGFVTAANLGLQAPDIIGRSLHRARETEHLMHQAAGQQLDDTVAQKRAGVAAGLANFMGKKIPGSKDSPTLGGTLVGGAMAGFGKELGSMGANLLRDMASKAQAFAGGIGSNAAKQAILQQLKKEDMVLANADDKVLMEAYHSMERFAPTLATDKNAVRSFLRQAVMSGTGPDYMSIKLLADAERAVNNTHPGKDR